MAMTRPVQPKSSENLCSYNNESTVPLRMFDTPDFRFVADSSNQGGELSSADFSFTDYTSARISPQDLQTQLNQFSHLPELESSKESQSELITHDSYDSFPIDAGQDFDWSALEADHFYERLASDLNIFSAPGLTARSISEAFDLDTFGSQDSPSIYRRGGHEMSEGVELGSSINAQESTPSLTECSTPSTLIIPLEVPALVRTSDIDLLTDDQCWHAVSVRSRAADRLFVYGVQSTKIYCRPSCPSRRPSRRHARFFLFPGAINAAEKANFRACKRCKPNTTGTANAGVLGVGLALRRIAGETNRQGDTSSEQREESKLEVLAKAAGLSTFHFHRLFKAITRMTPGEYTNACHSLALQDALGKDHEKDSGSEAEVTLRVEEFSRWSARTARKALGGISPAMYAQGAKEVSIEYTLTDTAFGLMCVVWSKKNGTSSCCEVECSAGARVHALLLGEESEKRTRERFPFARASNEHSQWLRECTQMLEDEGKDRETELPAEAVPLLRRAKVWLRLVNDPMMGGKWEGKCTQIS